MYRRYFILSNQPSASINDKFISINVECDKTGYEKEEEQI